MRVFLWLVDSSCGSDQVNRIEAEILWDVRMDMMSNTNMICSSIGDSTCKSFWHSLPFLRGDKCDSTPPQIWFIHLVLAKWKKANHRARCAISHSTISLVDVPLLESSYHWQTWYDAQSDKATVKQALLVMRLPLEIASSLPNIYWPVDLL